MDSAWKYGISRRSEPGLEALSEWLSGAFRRHKGTRWGVWGGTIGGSFGFVGAIAGNLINHHGSVGFVVFPFVLWFTLIGVMTAWLVKALKSDENAELSGGVSSRVLTMLANAGSRGKIRSAVGDEYAVQLNEGAKLALRCRGLLDSPAMKQAAMSPPWDKATDRVRNAMDSGMIRLLGLAIDHGDEADLRSEIADMRALVDEVAEAERRRSSEPSGRGARTDTLRSTLLELKELSRAEEEARSELRIGELER